LSIDDETGVEVSIERSAATPEGSCRKPGKYGGGAASVPGRKATRWREAATGLMEKIVYCDNNLGLVSLTTSTADFNNLINLRVQHRMHGSVGGRRGQPRLLPDPTLKQGEERSKK
jgi:hypothetical protein